MNEETQNHRLTVCNLGKVSVNKITTFKKSTKQNKRNE